MTTRTSPRIRMGVALLAVAGYWSIPGRGLDAQAGVSITSPAANAVLAAGPDYATDVLGDPWDMSNVEDITVDPAQKRGWSTLGFAAGRVGGTLAAVNGAVNGSHVGLLERAYWGIINPGRTGARSPIPSTTYTKLAFKMQASPGTPQSPRIYWFQNDLGHPSGDGVGFRYVNPIEPVPSGNNVYVVDLTQNLVGGSPWVAAPARGLAIYPNSSAIGYDVWIDWVRLTTADAHPSSARQPITWSGGSGSTTIDVQDAAGTWTTIASGISGTSFDWNYGVLPPGVYTLRVTRGGVAAPLRTFRINAPPSIQITDPDATGGEDFATAVLGNPWDMNDGADIGSVPGDHLIARSFSGGQFHGTSDGVAVAMSGDVPVGDPLVYPLTNNGVVDTTRYRYLTYRLQVDGPFDLRTGSVARLFWGSNPAAAYDVTVTKDIIVWPGMRDYTVDLAALTTAADGGIVTSEGRARPWTAEAVRYLRLDPHEFAEVRDFHIDSIKLAAMDEPSGGTFVVRFTGADADGDSVSVALYYDTDTNPANGRTLITSSVPLGNGQFAWNTAAVPSGVYYINAVASDGRNATSTYSTGPIDVRTVTRPSQPLTSLDAPAPGTTVARPFVVHGWALDRGAGSGTGVDAVHVYAFPNPGSGEAPLFLGLAEVGRTRADVGAVYGDQFTGSGYRMEVGSLAAGSYLLAVYAHSTVSGQFDVRTAAIEVPGPLMALDQPAAGATLTQPFTLSGWAIDRAAASGTGVDTLHVWAYPNPGSGAAPVFAGVAQYGAARSDVGAAFGSRFTNSGYSLPVKGLAPGPYQLVVFSRSTATGTFNASRTVFVTLRNSPQMALDAPSPGTAAGSVTVRGWAIDLAAATGPGVDAIHVWGYRNGGAAQFLGTATYGSARADVGSAFGSSQFSPSGYSLALGALQSGTWDIVVYARSSVSRTFDNWRIVRITVP
jgi:hypothetical protein